MCFPVSADVNMPLWTQWCKCLRNLFFIYNQMSLLVRCPCNSPCLQMQTRRKGWAEVQGAGPATCVHAKLLQSCLTLCTPWIVVHQAPLSTAFSTQVYWSELSCPSPGGLAHPGIEPRSPAQPADASVSEPPGNPQITVNWLTDEFTVPRNDWKY